MRVLSICAATLAIAASTSAGAASRDIETSWGKPGVSLHDYQLDASICANEALKLDVAEHPHQPEGVMLLVQGVEVRRRSASHRKR